MSWERYHDDGRFCPLCSASPYDEEYFKRYFVVCRCDRGAVYEGVYPGREAAIARAGELASEPDNRAVEVMVIGYSGEVWRTPKERTERS